MTKKIIILIFIVLPIYAFTQDNVIDQVVAVVGRNIILKSDIETEYLNMLASGQTLEGDMRCGILENFLVEKLLIAEADLDSTIQTTPSQINQQLDYTMEQYLNYYETEEAVEKLFNKPFAQIKSDMRQDIENSIISGQMQNKIVENITVTPSEVRSYYRNLDDDEILTIPEQYEYAQIIIKPEISIAEENRIKATLRNLKSRIEAGERFDMLAIMYSEGPSASDGGEIGFMGRAQLDPAYAEVAFNLRPGRISNVVQSEMGYHILEVLEKQGDKVNTRHILMQPKIEPAALDSAYNMIDSMANIIRKEEINFEDAALLFSDDEDSRVSGGMVVNQNTMTYKFTLEELDADVSKIITELNINEISDPFLTADSESMQSVYKIIKLINKTEEHKANIQDDYLLIADQFLSYKKTDTFNKWILDQQEKTYIRIDPTYTNCNFDLGEWSK